MYILGTVSLFASRRFQCQKRIQARRDGGQRNSGGRCGGSVHSELERGPQKIEMENVAVGESSSSRDPKGILGLAPNSKLGLSLLEGSGPNGGKGLLGLFPGLGPSSNEKLGNLNDNDVIGMNLDKGSKSISLKRKAIEALSPDKVKRSGRRGVTIAPGKLSFSIGVSPVEASGEDASSMEVSVSKNGVGGWPKKIPHGAMSALSWNVQGLQAPLTLNKPFLVFLMETRNSEKKVDHWRIMI
ncbi:uncharacterized protein G2W53_003307 [Senna tora]|uniref:Uncharacterized protein n=1 Tax=Senna tora TaxID=362788 RepID=A0A834XBB6_9FABA|nr:uncharacterized protein G2W53_003307 [Senna tora]